MKRLRLSFKKKLLLGITLSIFSVFGVGGAVSTWLIQERLQEQARQQMEVTGQGIHAMVRSVMMNAIKNYLKGISETNLAYVEHVYSRFKAGEISEQQAKALAEAYMLKQKIGSSGYVTAVDVNNGGIKLAVHPNDKGHDISEFPFARQMAKQRNGYLEFKVKNPGDSAPRLKSEWMSFFEPWHWIINAAPFLDEYPQLVDLAGIETELAKVKMQGKGYAFIMDMRGTLLSHPAWKGRNMMDAVDSHTGAPYMRTIIESIRRAREQNQPEKLAGVIRYHLNEPQEDRIYSRMMNYRYVPEADFIVGVVTDLDQLEAPLRVIRNTQIIVMSASLLLSLLVVVYAVRPMTRSIDELAAAVGKIDGGNLDTPLPALGSDEIGFLASAFGHMTERLVLYTNDLEHQVAERTQTIAWINEDLAAREILFQNILDTSMVAIFLVDMEGRITLANRRMAEMFHCPLNALMGNEYVALVHPSEREIARKRMLDLLHSNIPAVDTVRRFWRDDHTGFWGHLSGSRFHDASGNQTGLIGIIADITERKNIEEAVHESEEKHRIMFMDSPDAYLIIRDGVFVDCNRASEVMLRGDRTRIVGCTPDSLSPEFQPDGKKSSHSAEEKIEEAFRTGSNTFEWVHRRFDGTEFFVEVTIASMLLEGKQSLFTSWRDITGRKQAEKALEEYRLALEALSSTDGLTGIANRRRFDEVLNREYARHARSGAELSLILLDIDHFKAFNDTYGHVAGDDCLRRIGRAIADCAGRPADLAARYGGEEFACILPETDRAGAVIIAEQIRRGIQALALPHKGSDIADCVTASLGVATLRCKTEGAVIDIISQADELLYRAKSRGRNRVEFAAPHDYELTASGKTNGDFVRMVWNDSFCCGNQQIDAQHQSLFHLSNELFEAVLSGRPTADISLIISRLLDDVGQHFHDEEIILETAAFPGMSHHAAEHARLLEKGLELSRQFSASTLQVGDLFQFLAYDVVMVHMLGADREYYPFIRNTLPGNTDPA